ncbi:hypothetical protein CRG98_049357, partial [Punica granatum]
MTLTAELARPITIMTKQNLHNALFEDADGWASDAKVVQLWNKFFVVPCLVAFFIDPLFFFLLGVQS